MKKMNEMKKYWKIGVLILVVLSIFILPNQNTSELPKAATTEKNVVASKTEKLPLNWKIVEEIQEDVVVKLEKIDDKSEIMPIIVLTKSAVPEGDFKAYFQDLLDGAKSSLPSFEYQSPVFSKFKKFTVVNLTGSYFNENSRVRVTQRYYVKDQNMFLMTASYSFADSSLSKDVESIFSFLVSYLDKN